MCIVFFKKKRYGIKIPTTPIVILHCSVKSVALTNFDLAVAKVCIFGGYIEPPWFCLPIAIKHPIKELSCNFVIASVSAET